MVVGGERRVLASRKNIPMIRKKFMPAFIKFKSKVKNYVELVGTV